MQRFEYKFVRLDSTKHWLAGAGAPTKEARESYPAVVHEHAAEGWRLVQIFAPGLGVHGVAAYFELIFERPAPGGREEGRGEDGIRVPGRRPGA